MTVEFLRSQRIEIRHLEALAAVAEEGTFRNAADLLGYSQAAISQQIAALEAAVGQPVFDRPGGPKPVTLTPVGRILLRHAEPILERLDTARAEINDLVSGARGRLVCGTFESVSVELLPMIVRKLLAETPELLIRAIEEDDNPQLLEHLTEGTVDVTFLTGPVGETGLDVVELGTDPFVAVLPNEPRFAKLKAFPVSQLVPTGLIGEHVGVTQSRIEDALRAHGVQPRYVFRTNDNAAMQAMVRAGMGAAVMPLLAVDTADPEIVVRPLDPPLPPRSLVLALPPVGMRTPAAERFAHIAADVARQRLRQGSGVSE